jgi:mannose-6-phosphate isomerase-like protein (cupin superfamily)
MRHVKLMDPGEGRIFTAAGDYYTFKAVSEDTACTYTLIEAIVPKDGGSWPHIHHREDEGFYILEGEIIFYAGGQIFKKGAGSFVNIPRETVHYFKNRGDCTAKILIFYGPAGFERVFFESGTEVQDTSTPPPPTSEEAGRRFLEVSAKYGTEVLLDVPVEI